jgi:hypothetical protein
MHALGKPRHAEIAIVLPGKRLPRQILGCGGRTYRNNSSEGLVSIPHFIAYVLGQRAFNYCLANPGQNLPRLFGSGAFEGGQSRVDSRNQVPGVQMPSIGGSGHAEGGRNRKACAAHSSKADSLTTDQTQIVISDCFQRDDESAFCHASSARGHRASLKVKYHQCSRRARW